MIDYSFKNDTSSITHVIERLLHNPSLTDWEKLFVKSIKKYNEDGGFLSLKQLGKLSDLWEKY